MTRTSLLLASTIAVASGSLALAGPGGTIAQQAYLKASNPHAGDRFGLSVAISGDTAVVGAVCEGTGLDGVDGGAPESGAAYVFVRSGTTWTQQAYLKASNAQAGDAFGRSVAISGDVIVVGADHEDGAATGVDGDASDNGAIESGAAYVFVRNGTTWTQQAYLKASNAGAGDWFGASVAASHDTIVVGALTEDGGVAGDDQDESAPDAGALYVFVRKGATWAQQAYLKAANADAGDWFSKSVAISNDTIVVGADGEDGSGADPSDNSATWAGAAYVFVRTGTTWTQQAYLKASNAGAEDYFGSCVAASGDTVVISSIWEDSGATGVNGDQGDESQSEAGAAYVFVRTGTTWSQQAYLKASNAEGGDRFSSYLAIEGDVIAVAGQWEDGSATGLNGDQLDDGAKWSGATYLFARNAGAWKQTAYLKASNTGGGDMFGKAVALSGNTLIVTSDHEAGGIAGVDGDQDDNSAYAAGAGYVFDLRGWADGGPALPGVHGKPRLVGTGTLAAGSANALGLGYAAADAPCALFVALSSAPVAFHGGVLSAYPLATAPILGMTSPTGALPLEFTLPQAMPAGTRLWLQYGILDVAAPAGVALSNAVVGIAH